MKRHGALGFAMGAELAPPPPALAIRVGAFHTWVRDAAPGARIEYHRGFLPLDRERGFTLLTESHRRELTVIAARARALAETGHVLLVQERHGHCDYGYFAIKAQREARCSIAPRSPGGR